MVRGKLEERASTIVGRPEGFTRLHAPSDPGTGVIVQFDSADSARNFVSTLRSKGLPGNLYVRANRPPLNDDEKVKKEKIAAAWKQLVDAG
eukprot:4714361-Karenia_brevis.AAC.1